MSTAELRPDTAEYAPAPLRKFMGERNSKRITDIASGTNESMNGLALQVPETYIKKVNPTQKMRAKETFTIGTLKHLREPMADATVKKALRVLWGPTPYTLQELTKQLTHYPMGLLDVLNYCASKHILICSSGAFRSYAVRPELLQYSFEAVESLLQNPSDEAIEHFVLSQREEELATNRQKSA